MSFNELRNTWYIDSVKECLCKIWNTLGQEILLSYTNFDHIFLPFRQSSSEKFRKNTKLYKPKALIHPLSLLGQSILNGFVHSRKLNY